MAELGDAALRLLDPRWTTVTGTLREWNLDGSSYSVPPMSPWGPGGPPGAFGPIAHTLIVGVGADRRPTPGDGGEQRQRVLLRRSDGAYRIEHIELGVPTPLLTTIDGPDGAFMVPAQGAVRKLESPQPPLRWLTEPALLAGLYRLELESLDEYAGRTVAQATGTVRPVRSDLLVGAGPMLFGFRLGRSCEATIDVATGLCLRLATYDGDHLVSLRQFTEVEVDAPIPDEVFTYRLGPGERFRTHLDDQLDSLRAGGVDISGIDPNDEVAVQRALQDHHRREHERMRPGGLGAMHAPRSLSELVVPMEAGPEDPDVARASIQQALDALADDDRPRADGVERGELLDRDAEAGNAPARHPMLGDQTVTFLLGEVAFVRADEAMVEFQILLSGGGAFPVKGRAVLTADGWRLSYETWAGLQQMGGYRVPPVSGGD